MLKVGLKLWSTNTDHYLREAKRLYAEGVFDYNEVICHEPFYNDFNR
jgi:hypothetical protein